MVWDAIEPKNLVKSQSQQVLQQRLLRATFGLASDEPVQRHLPADNAIDQLLAQMAVGKREPRAGQRVFQQVLHEIYALATLQDPHCNFSWFLTAHNLIIPFPYRGASVKILYERRVRENGRC